MVKSKNLLGNKVLLLLAFVLFAIGFSIINNVFLVFGQTSYPQWRGTSNIKAPYLAENLDYLKQRVDILEGSASSTGSIFGNITYKSANTTYYADTDGFVVAYAYKDYRGTYTTCAVFVDGSRIAYDIGSYGETYSAASVTVPVKKGQYWKVVGTRCYSVLWVPISI